MYRVRLHGRGGQGIKTASRVLGSALFGAGYVVQDAPRYGAERRGAPIFAYVRAARASIQERGVIDDPSLVVVADDSLMRVPSAGVLTGLAPATVLLVRTRESADLWRQRVRAPGPVLTLPEPNDGGPEAGPQWLAGIECAGAAARLLGVVTRAQLEAALRSELADLDAAVRMQSEAAALSAFDAFAPHAGSVVELQEHPQEAADWVDVAPEPAARSAPTIFGGGTSVKVSTGLWRTVRPVIDHARCHRCHWMCALPCPDSAINIDALGYPQIDLDHCKGCLICVAQCPFHVISAVPEHAAVALQAAGAHTESSQ
jgi:pyruvate ferredoxin oxidoreductase gamma subunit